LEFAIGWLDDADWGFVVMFQPAREPEVTRMRDRVMPARAGIRTSLHQEAIA